MRSARSQIACALALPIALATIAAGCGGSDETTTDVTQAAPAASAFPEAKGTLEDLIADNEPGDDLVVSPAGSVLIAGQDNRLGFGVFNVDGTQVTDADVAIYTADGPNGQAQGPFPARTESLETEPAFTAQTTANDPDAAKAVYVADLNIEQPGEVRMVALVKTDSGYAAIRIPSLVAETPQQDRIPEVGEKAPVIHTPTLDDVGNVTEIDTRIPPSSMHDVDFADVVGKKPVVLVFATPQLCVSRVCGPVVDVAEQVKRDRPDDADYIHMEIWNDNDPNKGARQQVLDYHLRTEPWLFVINSDGTVSTRIEGAYSVDELDQALDKVH